MITRHFNRFVFLCVSHLFEVVVCTFANGVKCGTHVVQDGQHAGRSTPFNQLADDLVIEVVNCCPLDAFLYVLLLLCFIPIRREKKRKNENIVNNKSQSSSLGASTKWRQVLDASATFGASSEYDLVIIKEFQILFSTTTLQHTTRKQLACNMKQSKTHK